MRDPTNFLFVAYRPSQRKYSVVQRTEIYTESLLVTFGTLLAVLVDASFNAIRFDA